ncbi:MAG: phosphatidate cytidylyltransferase [Ignavibacteriaceae bacterium]|nr:phosphatidate cytidylyltransferase [Ignavibacteriaceae bacterium]
MSAGNITKRVLISVLGIPLIIAVCYLGSAYFFTFVLAVALISFYEYSMLVKVKGANTNTWLGFLGIIFLLINQVNYIFDMYSFLVIFMLLLTLFELFRNNGSVIYNVGSTLLGVFYIGLFAGSLLGIREFFPAIGELYTRGGLLIISIFIGIWVCDSAAFFGGTALGKHKLFPRVSPNKSWEGAVFGFLFAIISMILLKPVLLNFLSWTNIIVIGIIIGSVGQIGDLIESLIKRDAGVKDSSNLIPGHGGIFDRFDSILFTAPVVLLYLKFFL